MARQHTGGRASALPLNLIAQALPMLTRNQLAAVTERLIERLDELDGDADLEDDDANEDDDPGATDLDKGEWCDGEHAPAPDYGIDQTNRVGF